MPQCASCHIDLLESFTIDDDVMCAQCAMNNLKLQIQVAKDSLRFIADQPCGRAPESDAQMRVCPESGDCVSEYCLSCYARVAIESMEVKL